MSRAENLCACGCGMVARKVYAHGHNGRRPALTRFREKYTENPASGCWEWVAYRNPGGYGTFAPDGTRMGLAHRWAYEHFVGPIPDGLQLDHLCRNRCCVNPQHLEPVTLAENVRRGVAAERAAALQLAKTSCARGHVYTPETTRLDKNGHRRCRICASENQRAYYARKVVA